MVITFQNSIMISMQILILEWLSQKIYETYGHTVFIMELILDSCTEIKNELLNFKLVNNVYTYMYKKDVIILLPKTANRFNDCRRLNHIVHVTKI